MNERRFIVIIVAMIMAFFLILMVLFALLPHPAAGGSNIRYTPTDAEVQQWENDLNNHIPAPCKDQNYWETQIGTGAPTWDDYFRFKADTASCPG